MKYIKKKKNTFPKAYNKRLGLAEIGGVGDVIYKSIRYDEYDYDDQANIVDYDISGAMIYPAKVNAIPVVDMELGLTGKSLIVSLCNLYDEINFKNDGSVYSDYVSLIMDWCKHYFHPYNIETLYEKYRDLKPYEKEGDRQEAPELIDGVFKVDDFMHDLRDFYQVYTFVEAFFECLNGKPELAYNLYKEGAYYDNLPFFEEYKLTSTYDKYVEDSNMDVVEAMQEANKHEHIHKNSLEEFRRLVIKDKKNIYRTITEWIPDLEVSLVYEYERNQCEYLAKVNSIFDICYYTLGRLIAVNAPTDDENTENYSDYWDGQKILICSNCGKRFIVKRGTAKYCDDPNCQRARNRKKVAAFRQREKEKE